MDSTPALEAPSALAADRVAELWRALAAGAAGDAPALRQFVLCTSTGAAAEGRFVILREVAPEHSALTFYSDRRAAKMSQLQGPATAVFWDPEAQLQLRLQGLAAAVTDTAQVEACWQRVGDHGRRNYRALRTPGDAVADARACAQLSETSGRENFAVVRLVATRLDALWLSRGERLQAARGSQAARWVQV